MNQLRNLRRFVVAKVAEGSLDEIRAYVLENAEDLAFAFDSTPNAIVQGLIQVEDDSELAPRLLDAIAKIESKGRERSREKRILAAQESADVLAKCAVWNGTAFSIDIVNLMADVLTTRRDMLVFTTDTFSVGVYMAPLIDLARLRRIALRALVDSKGLHIRWGSAGSLNLLPRVDRDATKVFINLRRSSVAA